MDRTSHVAFNMLYVGCKVSWVAEHRVDDVRLQSIVWTTSDYKSRVDDVRLQNIVWRRQITENRLHVMSTIVIKHVTSRTDLSVKWVHC